MTVLFCSTVGKKTINFSGCRIFLVLERWTEKSIYPIRSGAGQELIGFQRKTPVPHRTPTHTHTLTLSLLLHNASWETGYHCNFCNGGFEATCIPGDSLSRIYKGKGVYLRMLFHIKLIFLIRSQPFCPTIWGKKVPVFFIKKGIALRLIIFCCYSVARSVGIAFSSSCFARLDLAVTKNQRRTIVFGEDYWIN